jgi:hypothetical protein
MSLKFECFPLDCTVFIILFTALVAPVLNVSLGMDIWYHLLTRQKEGKRQSFLTSDWEGNPLTYHTLPENGGKQGWFFSAAVQYGYYRYVDTKLEIDVCSKMYIMSGSLWYKCYGADIGVTTNHLLTSCGQDKPLATWWSEMSGGGKHIWKWWIGKWWGGLETDIYGWVCPQSIPLTKSFQIVHLLFLSAFLACWKEACWSWQDQNDPWNIW